MSYLIIKLWASTINKCIRHNNKIWISSACNRYKDLTIDSNTMNCIDNITESNLLARNSQVKTIQIWSSLISWDIFSQIVSKLILGVMIYRLHLMLTQRLIAIFVYQFVLQKKETMKMFQLCSIHLIGMTMYKM